MTDRHDRSGSELLRRVSRLPPLTVFLGTLVLGLLAFFAPGGYGAALVLLFAGALGVLLAATWHSRTPLQRVMRIAVLGVLVLIAVVKLQ